MPLGLAKNEGKDVFWNATEDGTSESLVDLLLGFADQRKSGNREMRSGRLLGR